MARTYEKEEHACLCCLARFECYDEDYESHVCNCCGTVLCSDCMLLDCPDEDEYITEVPT